MISEYDLSKVELSFIVHRKYILLIMTAENIY